MSETNDPTQGYSPLQQNSQQLPESNYPAPELLAIPLTSPQGVNQSQQGSDIPPSTPFLGADSPPAGGYSPPRPGEYPPPPASKPGLSSMSMIEQLIADAKLVVLHPSIASFDAIQSHASMRAVLLSIVGTGAAYGIGTLLFAPGAGLFAGLVGTFFGFFLSTALAFAAAKVLGGVGNFKTYAYTIAVFDLPLGVADGLCFAIPLLGTLTFLLSLFYGSYLSYLANRSVHRLSVGKSIIVGLVPLATLAFLALCAGVAVVVLILSGVLTGGGTS